MEAILYYLSGKKRRDVQGRISVLLLCERSLADKTDSGTVSGEAVRLV